ncbi:tyrosine/serine/threonine protein phosphatase MSG5 Ecym_3294 [Eremothecium cymbalariae DBVPG|uniref:protein-tyrosine-phosphatase n=1 Tax=Eremothecium cymbalariae (strain CBS 270.75 / DBVPG 7215 / KCTC 17166 / NRRL Y-17582) TaxID=931890 RepID=G8JRL8_ERECY|nr:Hypothetical protein Ecym_3294 [Eremothecium cymbalariae DBVPG\
MGGSLLDLKSRSPKSLQNKNTKKLSLKINNESSSSNKVVMIESLERSQQQQQQQQQQKQASYGNFPLLKTRSDAQIYTLPSFSGGASVPALKGSARRSLLQSNENGGLYHHGQPLRLTVEITSFKRPVPRIGSEKVRCKSLPTLSLKSRDAVSGRGSISDGMCSPRTFKAVNTVASTNADPVTATRSWVFQRNGTPVDTNPINNVYNHEDAAELCDDDDDDDDDYDIENYSFSSSMHSYTYVFDGNVYPGDPLCVVEPGIFLYSEPTLEQVLEFDLVINVAKEINNLRSQLPDNSTTEYHQFRWSHTSKICGNLEELTKLMHDAVLQNKKVLVHCQCGVSRSASLIVAYIMRYRKMSLNDAYNHLKNIAKDISPNMNLIFQLMEWGECLKGNESQANNRGDSSSCRQLVGDVHDHGLANIEQRVDNANTATHVDHECSISPRDHQKPSLSSPNGSSVISAEATPRTPKDFINTSIPTSFAGNMSGNLPPGTLGSTTSTTPETTAPSTNSTENDRLTLKKDLCMQYSLVLDAYPQPPSDIVEENW